MSQKQHLLRSRGMLGQEEIGQDRRADIALHRRSDMCYIRLLDIWLSLCYFDVLPECPVSNLYCGTNHEFKPKAWTCGCQ